MADLNIGEILTTAIENRTRKLADNVSDNNALADEAQGTRQDSDRGRW